MIDFQFVHVDASSAKARKRNHQLARAHSARTHRRKRRDELIDITIYDPSELPLITTKAGKDAKSKGPIVKVTEKTLLPTPASSTATTPLPHHILPAAEVLFPRFESPAPLKALSPVFGAFAPATFQPGSSPKSEQVAHYLMSVVFHNRLSYENALKRFQAFCEEPMLYHILHYCVAIYHDQVNDSLVLSRRPEMLWHKAEAIRLLNGYLSQIDDSNLDLVICTIMYLAGMDLEKRESQYTLLFRAHAWNTLWPWIDGQKLPVLAHVDALKFLVEKRGGLPALQMPGLGLSIARSDLVYASLFIRKPNFPCLWKLDDETLAAYQEVQLCAGQVAASGLSAIAGMLPYEVLDVLVNIANTSRLLTNHLDVFSLSSQQLEAARCIAHHQLLCLSAWDDTDGIYSEWADETVYECCRLTGILYSNAVILGLPPHCGWHITLCKQIRQHLEACDLEDLSGDAPGLLIWILTIACIAAYSSDEEDFFLSALRAALEREGLETRKAREEVLEGYLWSSELCGSGADLVWKALELD